MAISLLPTPIREECLVNKGENDDDFQIFLYKIMKKIEWCRNLVARNKMTATQIIEKNYSVKIQNLIDESADSRLNWNGIVSKFNRPCGFI